MGTGKPAKARLGLGGRLFPTASAAFSDCDNLTVGLRSTSFDLSEIRIVPHSAIAVFTGNSRDEILAVGGSVSWVVAEKQARRREFLVCIRNAREVDFHDHEPHGTAFLVGRISGLKPFEARCLSRTLL